ncbi:amidohydrolase family protein [Subtercola lobariae]|uniref:Amidohydrolase-related domain-containing protein n=1 Tax=Subtercola lobariae TaxID=1588641 RepID=A0A917EWM2_9MICO|nr:amidohydrolase family protein [Subtercola lobariae]GGF22462.1 hypothetical protein GCM10011399_15160 [Subtercola lobariae]
MKIITIEEHYSDPAVRAASDDPTAAARHDTTGIDPSVKISYTPSNDELTDLGEGRLVAMDSGNIAMQVLSSQSVQRVPASVAVEVVRATNDKLAAAIAEHPDRFAGFAALPTTVPDAAADELERGVGELGFVGAMIMGRTNDQFLDEARFDVILKRLAKLDVPLYLHPGLPPTATIAENYSGFAPLVSARLGTAAWGWHSETGVHFIRLVLSGVLDRYPKLQVILGHWGEMVPFFIERLDEALPRAVTHLDRTFAEYMRENVYVTPSGMFTQANLQYVIEMMEASRIMYSVDYPFVGNDEAEPFLLAARLTDAQREAIAHGTAERLFRL